MTHTRTITRVTYRWDTTDPVHHGWYCEGYDTEGEIISDSVKIWWPVDVDEYDSAGWPKHSPTPRFVET